MQKRAGSKNIELAQNNVELILFTYIASLDQGHLRKIRTFCNRILDDAAESLRPGQ
jgi:hypothetical protein